MMNFLISVMLFLLVIFICLLFGCSMVISLHNYLKNLDEKQDK